MGFWWIREYYFFNVTYDVSMEKLSSVSSESCAVHVVLHEDIEKRSVGAYGGEKHIGAVSVVSEARDADRFLFVC